MSHASYSNLDIKFGAASLLVSGVPELISEYGNKIDEVIQTLGISRQAALAIRDMSAYDMPDFCKKVEGRKAAWLVIDYKTTIEIAEILAKCSEGQLDKLRSSTEKYMKSLSVGEATYKTIIVSKFISYISRMMYEVEQKPGDSNIGNIPPKLFSALQELKQGVMHLYTRLLVQRNVINVEVDKVAMDTVIAGFKAHVRGRKLLHDLIKAGAHLTFIEQYNNERYIDVEYYRQWRRFHSVGRNSEKITPSVGVDIYQMFNQLMATNIEVIDVYFELHRKFRFRIETLYTYIQSTLTEVLDDDDDDDEELFGSVMNIINHVNEK
ncbi:hypothetical protein PULV_a4000 [Pseudoalteromonas ulvae UL12]|uniref:hypothetical protein n=1 Tax=Pseudoalteromonas ulvae TaxID=107327 RepID=UPI00186BA381|nr:hypothetical protein [Pseudoalteromonas ulvae]MBE0362189.1 hypothetical protein [Pseudoalteromonas ulvae UL12]